MNTGFVRLAVATVPTVYGIETHDMLNKTFHMLLKLQQYLPFTVLKLEVFILTFRSYEAVATVPTVYGIET